jgi:tetratricopeptide (TPR) repeat protein
LRLCQPRKLQRAFRQAIETLLSPQSTFAQKQAVWKQLKDAGQMDDAIAELERRLADSPDSVEDAVALAQAYLKECGQTDDIRQRAMLAMKADLLLDTALSQDPSNWEAQFDKVSSMARWPLELNQGPKVLEQFQTLIQEQESQPTQPQFALTYLRLGDYYERTGDANEAVQVWQRGDRKSRRQDWPLQALASHWRRRLRRCLYGRAGGAGQRRRVALKVIKLGMDTKVRSSPASRPSARRWR